MVRFSKQFESQLVPEWKEAFVDYWQLKKDLKRIHLIKQATNASASSNLDQEHAITTLFSYLRNFAIPGFLRRRDSTVIQVHKKLACSASKGDEYETVVLEQLSDCEASREFFACLDQQLNKVNQFYRAKEKEFLDRGESLKQQVEILAELKGFLDEQCSNGKPASCVQDDTSMSNGDESVQSQDSDNNDEQGALELPLAESGNTADVPKADKVKTGYGKLRTMSSWNFSCQGKNMSISIPLTTPSQALSAVGYLVWEDIVSPSSKKYPSRRSKTTVNATNLHHAQKMIRQALIELYKGLEYLNSYRNLNMLAFVKILKKFDKATGKEVLPVYLEVVESSYFNTSIKVINSANEVEELFTRHFAGGDRRRALKYLRPLHRKESHGKTFFIGLFTGCFVALLISYVTMAHITGKYKRQQDPVYMETVYPVLSMFSLLFLHFFLYGCNMFAWRKARINYSFIFELAPTKELKYRDVFFICALSMVVVVGIMFAHLALLAKGFSYEQVGAIPRLLLLGFLLVLVCPLNIFYQSSRLRLLRVIRNIVLSPMYKVVMLDFFMADQLCSQVPMLRNLEYVTCYYATGSHKNQDYRYFMETKHYRDLAYAVSFLPYYWRAMQCSRKWFDEGDKSHLVNLGKYVSAMLAAGAKVAYEKEQTSVWLFLVVVLSSAATIYQLYWDYVKDWGLLQPNSRNPWLRNELMLHQKTIYYFSMGLNFILRLAWLQTVLHNSFENVDYRVTGLFLAALEVIRRGMWNFYRLENEHLNNAGNFRAVKTVPLPFHEVDEED